MSRQYDEKNGHDTWWYQIVLTIGWIAATLVTAFSKNASVTIAFLTTVFCSFILILNRETPNRTLALRFAWLGPLIFGGSNLMISKVQFSITAGYITSAYTLASGLMNALVIVWLFRLYGLILFVGALRLFPVMTATSDDLCAGYPPRYWWVVPTFFAVAAIFLALIGSLLNIRFAT